jgi:hypothetical protein
VALVRRNRGRLWRADHGAGLVEFALVLPLVLTFFFAVFEFGHQFYARLTIRHAVAEATRYAVTGRFELDSETGEPLERAESIRLILERHAVNLALAVEDVTLDPSDGGGPEEVVNVSASFRYEYWLPGLKEILPETSFTVTTSMRNEPFEP